MTITSPHNEKLKAIRKLNAQKGARAQAGRFVAPAKPRAKPKQPERNGSEEVVIDLGEAE